MTLKEALDSGYCSLEDDIDFDDTPQGEEIACLKLEIDRLNRLLSIEKEYREKFDKDNQRLYKIINETSEILKFHLSNPSQTINGWHIDIWNSKDIEKLNKMLNIIEIKEENNG